MKPDYRITLAITSLLIVGAIIFPPWKHAIEDQFVGFHYVFADESLVKSLEIDYARLAIIVVGIILTAMTVHILLLVMSEKSIINNSQHTLKKVQSSFSTATNTVTDKYIFIKAILLLLLVILSGYGE